MRKGIIIGVLIGASLFGKSSQALSKEENVGTNSATFLKIGQGARAVGMSEAFVAVAQDATTLYWNPAGLSQIKDPEATFMYLPYFQDITCGSIGLVQPTRFGTLGIGFIYLTHKDIAGYDENANYTGDYSAKNMSVNLAYGNRLRDNLLVGGTFKYISEEIEEERASGLGVDIGMLYKTPVKDLDLGLVVQNLGQDVKFAKEGASLPLNFKLGLSYSPLDDLMLATDLNLPSDNAFYGSMGLEYWIKKMIALRAGYKSGPQDEGNGVSAGFGFNISKFMIDYAFSSYGDLGENHYISFSVRF